MQVLRVNRQMFYSWGPPKETRAHRQAMSCLSSHSPADSAGAKCSPLTLVGCSAVNCLSLGVRPHTTGLSRDDMQPELHIHARIRTCVYTLTDTDVHTHIYMHMLSHMHVCACVYTPYAYALPHMCAHIPMHMFIHTGAHTLIHTYICIPTCVMVTHACTYSCAHSHTCIHMHAYSYTDLCMHMHTHTLSCAFVNILKCMHILIHVHSSPQTHTPHTYAHTCAPHMLAVTRMCTHSHSVSSHSHACTMHTGMRMHTHT